MHDNSAKFLSTVMNDVFFYVLVMRETDYRSATSGYHISPLSKTKFLNCKPFAKARTLKFEEYKLSTVEKYHNLLVAERYFTNLCDYNVLSISRQWRS